MNLSSFVMFARRSSLAAMALLAACATSPSAPHVAVAAADAASSDGQDNPADGAVDGVSADATTDGTADTAPLDTAPPGPVCNDGKIEGDEQCDGDDLNQHSCQSLGYATGQLACNAKCVIDKQGCGPAHFGDVCGGDLPDCQTGLTCVLFTEQDSGLGYCTKTCTEDTDCGTSPAGATCAFKLTGGKSICGFLCTDADPTCPEGLVCSKASDGDYSYCTTDKPTECGDGLRDVGEQCDGKDLDNLSCKAFGYSGGALGCTDKCAYDMTKCTGESACKDLPARDCTAGDAVCGKLELFEPFKHPTYVVTHGTKMSWLRHDTTMLVKYAAASVACIMPGSWPIGLGDMSMSNGGTPSNSAGQLRHPKGTHDAGRDIDMAYYQLGTKDNYLRPVCEHTIGGKEQYHCTGDPISLDVPRSTLYVLKMVESERTRVIGCDGKIGPLLLAHAKELQAQKLIRKSVVKRMASKLAFEVTDEGAGWFRFHHHHLHLSTYTSKYAAPPPPMPGDDGRGMPSGTGRKNAANPGSKLPPMSLPLADEWAEWARLNAPLPRATRR